MSELNEWMRKQFGWGEDAALSAPLWKDDWTLIIKLHAMIETALNGALLKDFEKPELAGIIAKLDTSNTAIGKAAFAKALGILMPSSVGFLQKLSELRNVCVHDIRNFHFDLVAYLENLSDKKRNELWKPIRKVVNPETPASCPQEALLIGAMSIMSQLMVHDLLCQGRSLAQELVHTKAARFDEQNQSTSKE